MTIAQFQHKFKSKKPLIGVVHLPALPGYTGSPGINRVIAKALIDIQTLEAVGFQAALVENDGDHPPHIGYHRNTSQCFEQVMTELLPKTNIPLGLEILYDMPGTIKLASKVHAAFVRLDVFVDGGITRYGPVIPAEPKKIIGLKRKLNPDLLFFTDIHVKHLTMVDKEKSVSDSVREATAFGTDGIIITGHWTGQEPSLEDCVIAKQMAPNIPILIGSGLSGKNCNKLLAVADGAIIATSMKSGQYIDPKKAKLLLSYVKGNI